MLRTIFVLLIFLSPGYQLFSQTHYKTNLCGVSGTLERSQLDSLLNSGCKKITLIPLVSGSRASIKQYTVTWVPKSAGTTVQVFSQQRGNLLYPDVIDALKKAKEGDMFIFSNFIISGAPIPYEEKKGFSITVK